ncbi:MAG: beta strand repeat-containing protein, partial [Pyrinomonadaceae bacterium]
MNYHTSSSSSHTVRTFIASLLSYLLLASQLAPMAMALNGPATGEVTANRSETALKKTETTRGASPKRNALAPVPMPLGPTVLAPNITATKVDTYPSSPGGAQPGEIITYNITVSNTGPDPATNVTLSDTVDTNTAIVGIPLSTPIAFADAFNVLGNVRIQVPDGASDLLANDRDPDTDTNTGLTITTLGGDNSAPFAGASANNGQVTATTGDGSFQYNPPPGFTGTDTFTYTATDSDGGTSSATVTLTITGMIWFVNSAAAAGGDGRLTNPFNCFVGTGCFSDSAADEGLESIFLFNGSYTGGFVPINGQKVIGQGASDTLANIAGVTVPTHSDSLPATNGNPANVTITTTLPATNAFSVSNGGITVRGFTIGNTTGAKILGGAFGTLTAGNNTTPDLTLNGTGKALELQGGTFATSGFTSVTTTSSPTQGIQLTSVSGTVSLGSTTVSNSTTQGILVNTSFADINFGNTSVTGGTDGVSLQNNSTGTRTFGALTISNNSGVGFLSGAGGGNATITGTTMIPGAALTAPVGTGIDIQSLATGTAVSFAATIVNKGNAGTGVNLGGGATGNVGNVTFNSLSITTTNGTGLLGTGNTGQAIVTTNAGSIAAAGGPAINITKAAAPASPITLNFTNVASSNSPTQGVNLDRVSGNMTNATTTATNSTGVGIQVQNTSAGGTMNFGNTSSTLSAGTGVFLNANAGGITFAD